MLVYRGAGAGAGPLPQPALGFRVAIVCPRVKRQVATEKALEGMSKQAAAARAQQSTGRQRVAGEVQHEGDLESDRPLSHSSRGCGAPK